MTAPMPMPLRAWRYLERNPGVTRERMAAALGISQNACAGVLKRLRQSGHATCDGGRGLASVWYADGAEPEHEPQPTKSTPAAALNDLEACWGRP